MKENSENVTTQLVYCVVRYGQLVGCYKEMNDAVQVQTLAIQKGQICDLIVKPLL